MFYAHIYQDPLDHMTDVKMITITEDKSLKEDKEEQLRFLRFRNCDKWRLENTKQKKLWKWTRIYINLHLILEISTKVETNAQLLKNQSSKVLACWCNTSQKE